MLSRGIRGGAALVCLLALGSCISREFTEPNNHSETTLLVRADVSVAASVASLVVEVTAPDITRPLVFNIPISGGIATGTIA